MLSRPRPNANEGALARQRTARMRTRSPRSSQRSWGWKPSTSTPCRWASHHPTRKVSLPWIQRCNFTQLLGRNCSWSNLSAWTRSIINLAGDLFSLSITFLCLANFFARQLFEIGPWSATLSKTFALPYMVIVFSGNLMHYWYLKWGIRTDPAGCILTNYSWPEMELAVIDHDFFAFL